MSRQRASRESRWWLCVGAGSPFPATPLYGGRPRVLPFVGAAYRVLGLEQLETLAGC
jgi:hypothetical protein